MNQNKTQTPESCRCKAVSLYVPLDILPSPRMKTLYEFLG